jgi:hypothetical protein
MNIFKKIVGKLLTVIGSDPIATGTVINKLYYPADGLVQKEVETAFNKGREQVTTVTQAQTSTEGWSFLVKGKDKMGNEVTEEIYVDPLVWSTTKIGDTYTPKGK